MIKLKITSLYISIFSILINKLDYEYKFSKIILFTPNKYS